MTEVHVPTGLGAAVLRALAAETEGELIDLNGRAVRALADKLAGPPEVAALSQVLTRLEGYNLIRRDVTGRRTYGIALTTGGRQALTRIPAPTPTPEPPPVTVDGDQDVQGRPGRVAARLEKTLPPLVEEAVKTALGEVITDVAAKLGFVPARPDVEEGVPIDDRITTLERVVEQLQKTLRVERQLGEATRAERNRLLARVEPQTALGRAALRPSDLPEAWRSLAGYAIDERWVITRTNGGHLRWTSPDGQPVFSPSTTSDWRAVRNHRSDLEGYGLPKQAGGAR